MPQPPRMATGPRSAAGGGDQPPVFDPACLARATIEVLAAQADSPAALARRQQSRLQSVVAAARAGSALYRERLRGVVPGRTPLADWPTVGKAELMARFDHWVTDPALRLAELQAFTADPRRIGQRYAGRYQVWESSGSSGVPAIFVHDAWAMAVYDALETLRRPARPAWQRWTDPMGLAECMVFVGAIDGHFASQVQMLRLGRINPWLAGRLHSVSILQPTAALVAQLQALAPTVVATYPSVALLLADEAAAGRLPTRPRELWTGGETLNAGEARRLQLLLGCSVSNSYGASEFLPLGWQCAHGRLHANTDWALLEPVDEQMRPVPAGQRSHTTLLTHLAQTVQPLIRYDLGDRLTVAAEQCGCGSVLPVIEVQGRCDERLRMAGTDGRIVTLLPLALTNVLEDDAGLFDFELRQRDRHTLELRLPLPEADGAAALARGCAALQAFAVQQGVDRPRVVGACGCIPTRGRSGKAQRISALPD